MKDYLYALLSPLGRLSLPAYWALAGPLALVIVAVRWHLKEIVEFGSTWTAVILVLMGMQACLLARRLQDCDWNGIVVLPLIGFSTFALLVDLDPFLLGNDLELAAKQWAFINGLSYIGTGLTAIVCVYALLIFGDSTDNTYGPPFGETSESAQQKHLDRIRQRVRAEFDVPVEPVAVRTTVTKTRGSGGRKLITAPVAVDPTTSSQWETGTVASTALGFPTAPARKSGFGRH